MLNALPSNLRNAVSLQEFKKNLKSIYYSQQSAWHCLSKNTHITSFSLHLFTLSITFIIMIMKSEQR